MDVVVQPIKNTVEVVDAGTPVEVRQVKQVVDVTAPGPQGVQGPQGIQGPPGAATIGGYPVSMANVAPGDIVQFGNQNAWVNAPEQALTDGGNF